MKLLEVANWDTFQHYTDRRPPWIKFYTSLLSDYDLNKLPLSTRAVYDRLLLIAAQTENRIPNDPEWLAKSLQTDPKTIRKARDELLRIGKLKRFSRKHDPSVVLAKGLSRGRGRGRERDRKVLEGNGKVEPENLVLPVLRDVSA